MSEPRDIDEAYVPDWLGRLADANTRVLQLEAENTGHVTGLKQADELFTLVQEGLDRNVPPDQWGAIELFIAAWKRCWGALEEEK